MKKKKNRFLQFGEFAIAGTVATAINLGLLYILTEKAGIYYLISAAIAFLAGVTASFFINEKWTFHVFKHPTLEYEKYVFVNFCILIGNLIILTTLVTYFGMWYMFAQALAVMFLGILNFVIEKNWTFKE
jgi:dolichol-phosphate mannosyltransferase